MNVHIQLKISFRNSVDGFEYLIHNKFKNPETRTKSKKAHNMSLPGASSSVPPKQSHAHPCSYHFSLHYIFIFQSLQ